MGSTDHRARLRGDVLCALALAAVLSAGWAWRDWAALSALRLPDTDDMMRLQQIRDWIDGQAFADLAQHRLGAAPGLAMHWSRLPDLVPGAIVAALAPLAGRHGAELTAVLAWPAALFALALLLTARIARMLGGDAAARTAAAVAAVAYPATTVFLPGRIDHHGLQVVLLLLIARTLVAPPSLRAGMIAGFAAAASLAIGLETAPLLAAAGVVLAGEWIIGGLRANDRMMGFGVALTGGLVAASLALRGEAWGFPGCDGFAAVAWRAEIAAAFAPLGMALTARAGLRPVARVALGAGIATGVGGIIVWIAPACLHPYALVDPLLARLWLAKVGEAQSALSAPPATVIGYAGVTLAGVLASVWRLHVTRDPRWLALLALQLAAVVLTATQLRGAYAGAMLAAPALAAAIAAARTRGAAWLAGAWLGSAGMLYPLAAQALVPAPRAGPGPAPGGACTAPPALAELAALPPARLLAPLDLGAYAIGATRLSVVGAPYHRNNAGNLAVYRFFLGSPAGAARIARAWDVRYVATCADAFGEAGAGTTAAALRGQAPPRWLRPLPPRAAGLRIYVVEPGLFPRPSAR